MSERGGNLMRRDDMATMTIMMPAICVRSKFLQKDEHGGAKFRLTKAKGHGMRGEMIEL